jgi:hypothetical protein
MRFRAVPQNIDHGEEAGVLRALNDRHITALALSRTGPSEESERHPVPIACGGRFARHSIIRPRAGRRRAGISLPPHAA